MITSCLIDTNVWFFAFYGSINCQKMIKSHLSGHIKAVITEQILDELIINTQKKLPNKTSLLYSMFKNAPPIILKNPTHIPETIKPLAHSKDIHILAATIQAKIPYLVTGNSKDFKTLQIKQQHQTEIITPKKANSLILHP